MLHEDRLREGLLEQDTIRTVVSMQRLHSAEGSYLGKWTAKLVVNFDNKEPATEGLRFPQLEVPFTYQVGEGQKREGEERWQTVAMNVILYYAACAVLE